MFQEVESWCSGVVVWIEWATRRGSVPLQIGEQPSTSSRSFRSALEQGPGKGCSLREKRGRGMSGMDRLLLAFLRYGFGYALLA